MRHQLEKISAGDLEWTPTGAPGLFEKILNVDEETGARALLLKSVPRPRDQLADLRPQFHPVDEEFYCLSGRFTLEGDVWITPGTYVYYPPKLVHGFGVDVPGGYEIYLRNSGPLSTERVDTPAANAPYLIDHGIAAPPGVVVRHAENALTEMLSGDVPAVAPLRQPDRQEAGAFLVTLPAKARIPSPAAGYDSHIEMFMLSGEVELSHQTILSRHNYCFIPPGTAVDFIGLEAASTFIVNYSCDDIYDRFVEAGAEVVNAAMV